MQGSPATLQSLPRELKQQILRESFDATGRYNDVKIGLADDCETILFPALDIVDKLKAVDLRLFEEAKAYLFNKPSLFRFAFVGNIWPHRYILRAFRSRVPLEDRQKITHIYLEKYSSEIFFHSNDPSDRRSHTNPIHPASQRPYPNKTWDYFCSRCALKDMHHALVVFPMILPSVVRLDMGIDVIECISRSYGPDNRSVSVARDVESAIQPRRDINTNRYFIFKESLMNHAVLTLRGLRGVKEICVCWSNFLHRGDEYDGEAMKASEEKAERLFIRLMKHQIVGKTITTG
ncbi:hypothetical protein P280DRAFT_536441 [Massarina eburnea CBS 473.64]|uniref:Uncharacterized protein n=1 Tax=Massarina eburnea CBS 473.64 TaxID=1395130 RepID=A0A6A6RJT6_9PLEO|nr:hypothetical protein P280DRAFT_536441 [Massarina eburnea CBS 473.64]